MIDNRYSRNIASITEEEQTLLSNSHVAIIGCGGLGGNIFALLLRIGIGHITVVDGDSFDETNLNRQLLCTEKNLGMPKAAAAAMYAQSVNSKVQVSAFHTRFTAETADRLLAGCDLVIDALDNIESRRDLARACESHHLTMIYGAICGWNAQVSVIRPEHAISAMQRLYPDTAAITDKSCLAPTPSLCASLQAAEAVKYLLGKPTELDSQMMIMDLLYNDQILVPIG